MIAADPYMLILALVSLLSWAQAAQDGSKWKWGYAGRFAASIIGAYILP